MYTRITLRQAWDWPPFVFLRWMAIGAALICVLWRLLFWVGF